MTDSELDVRQLRKPDKHPTIFAVYTDLPVWGSFVLVNNHDPKHLHEEFEADHAGSYGWEYLEKGPTVWRIRISKLTTTPLPRIVTNTADIAGADVEPGVTGVAWKLEVRERDLDSNVIALAANGGINTHTGAGRRRLDPRAVRQRPADHRAGHHRVSPGRLRMATASVTATVHCWPGRTALPDRAPEAGDPAPDPHRAAG